VPNHHLAQAIADVGFYEFKRQMEYKGQWYDCKIILAPQFYPSTKRCSQCGHTKVEMGLRERVYTCDHCGLRIDRDLNAAINLEQLTTGSSSGRYACGKSVSHGYQAVLVEAGTEQQSASVQICVCFGERCQKFEIMAKGCFAGPADGEAQN
jgi:hypothetical protein